MAATGEVVFKEAVFDADRNNERENNERNEREDRRKEELRKEELVDRLRQGPGQAARRELGLAEGLVPSRWCLRTIRASVEWLSGYTLSGVWRLLKRWGLRLRSGQAVQYSPDPGYAEKEAHLLGCLEEAACFPVPLAFIGSAQKSTSSNHYTMVSAQPACNL